jgi:hypothetical protein
MSEIQQSWIEQHCAHLVPIERETMEKLGEETGSFFLNAANDCVTVSGTVAAAYPVAQNCNLMFLTLSGVFKEAYWFHSLFVAANYPQLLGRLRFVWESIFRAYFAEHYPMGPCTKWDTPGPAVADKLVWLDQHGKDLRWDTCIEPVLRAVFPLAEREQKVRDDYKELFQHLHRYAHPSAYLLDRMTDNTVFQIIDTFDERWARQTVDIGARVFDLVWMAVFAHYPDAFERIEPLEGKYPVLTRVFERG